MDGYTGCGLSGNGRHGLGVCRRAVMITVSGPRLWLPPADRSLEPESITDSPRIWGIAGSKYFVFLARQRRCGDHKPASRRISNGGPYSFAAETVRRVVIDHTDRLHPGVNDGGSDKLESALLQGPGDFLGEGSIGGNGAGVLNRLSVNECPGELARNRLRTFAWPGRCGRPQLWLRSWRGSGRCRDPGAVAECRTL